jgi:hypothetical protein
MSENIGARMLLFVAYLAAAVGYGSWIASQTVFDTDATKTAAKSLLSQPAVQASLTDDLAEQVDKELATSNPDPDVRNAVADALKDPRLIAAFSDAIGQFHAALIGERNENGKVAIDTRALVASVRDGLAQYDPQLAAEFERNARQEPISMEIGGDDVPSLGNTRDQASLFVLIGFGAALLLATISMLMLHDRKHFRRLGKRIGYLAAVPLLGFVLLPWVLAKMDGDAPQVVSALMRTYARQVVPSAIAFLIVGAGIIIATILWPKEKWEAAEPVPTLPQGAVPNHLMPTAPPTYPADAKTEKIYL